MIFEKIKPVVVKGDFTLGRAVDVFERNFAKKVGSKHAIGVGSGTDAIFLSLKALGIGEGDEVIAPTFTFYATIGAIATTGATPVFVDSQSDMNIDPSLIEAAITEKTKAIIPVHWTGKPCDMDEINEIALRHGLHIVEDACHAITASYKGTLAGNFGVAGCFSMHPLKNLNVWGDGGLVVTNDDGFAKKLRLIRNHGLSGRDTCEVFAYNSRLDTIQVVAEHLLAKVDDIIDRRISNSIMLDGLLSGVPQCTIPNRDSSEIRQVFHIYSLFFKQRDELQSFLKDRGIDAKVHYPVPMHLQPAASSLGYQKGDFPVAERISDTVLSLPVHEFITHEQINFMAESVRSFYQ